MVYCRRVAGAIGRLCVAIFGAATGRRGAREPSLADDLGVAMQLTNILRDLREDAEHGRVYLPGEDLRRFGLARCRSPSTLAGAARISADAIPSVVAGAAPAGTRALCALMRFEADRAQQWFARGLQLVAAARPAQRRLRAGDGGIYRRLLERIEARPRARAARARVAARAEKARVAARGARRERSLERGPRARRRGGGLAGITAALDCAAGAPR